jgi:NAD(P)-dependent dehydrogenase (short-subunit alcohol dehydrogenase family)
MIPDITPEDLDRTLAVNVRGMFFGVQAAMRAMSQLGGGAILNTSSVQGQMGTKALAPYVMSKHAIIGLSKTAALEGAAAGIRVNALCPGAVDTAMNRVSEELAGEGDIGRGRAVIESTISIGRYAKPDEIASMATWLLCDESSYASGAVFTVDAAMMAGNNVLG